MDDDKIELGPPGPFVAGVMAGIKASDAIDVPGETTFDQQSAFFWLHVGTSMARADLVDTESQIQFVDGAKTRAPSRDVKSEAFCGSQSYAAGRMTHAIIRERGFSGVQAEVVHDALMAAFQAGYLAAAEGVSVEDLLARMASL